MIKLSCPACGAEMQFKSTISVFGVCSYCSSMVVRHDMNLESLGTMAQLPDDMTPLQVGTRGRYKNAGFELIGRLKVGWESGTWNEWYAFFDTGKDGWLVEAQGFYSICFQVPDAKNLPESKNISPGLICSLTKGQDFQVDDIKTVSCIGSAGELPFQSPSGKKSTVVDLSGPNHQFATIDYADNGMRLYLGEYVEFDQLSLTALREVDGW